MARLAVVGSQGMTKLEKLVVLLSDGQWHSTVELVEAVGHRFSAAMHVAVHRYGYQVEKRRSGGNQFEYRKVD
jgi:hypothetical protein